jgi:hypothetical protein
MSTADLLTNLETCPRNGYYSRDWESNRFTQVQMIQSALRVAFLSDSEDYGEEAGSHVMDLAHERGLQDKTHSPYAAVTHAACLSDLLSTAIRGKQAPWGVPETLDRETYQWESGALLDPSGAFLRRVILASSWSEERHFSEVNSWRSIGEVAHYGLPMQQVVAVLGPHRDGKRHSPFTKGLIHPRSGKLRFRKKSQSTSTDFKDSWDRIWREDRAEITNHEWLSAMESDDVLKEHLFTVEIPVPSASDIGRIREMAARKLERLREMTSEPEPNLSTCYLPQCPFVICCHQKQQPPSEKLGFVLLES